MMQTKRCNRLYDFLMKKMLNSEKNYFSDEERYQAYRNFLRLTTKEETNCGNANDKKVVWNRWNKETESRRII